MKVYQEDERIHVELTLPEAVRLYDYIEYASRDGFDWVAEFDYFGNPELRYLARRNCDDPAGEKFHAIGRRDTKTLAQKLEPLTSNLMVEGRKVVPL